MTVKELLWSHRYGEAIVEFQRVIRDEPENMAALEGMAKALRGKGEYREALSFFERLAMHEREDKIANNVAPGRAAWQIDIACLYWLADDHSRAIRLMHGLAAGILDGSIKYGDAAGGMSQGLLLYYMAVTDNTPEEMSFALDYMRNRLKRSPNYVWPSPIGQHCLGDVTFDKVLEAVNRLPTLAGPPDPAKIELGTRRRLSVALFHDGVRSRAQGDEGHCLARMRECYRLENPLIEQEWYLARYEVQKANNQTRAG
jgi:hypothetical protein